MPEETTITADAAALVAMNVADLAAHLDGVDLATLQAALAAETAKGDAARKGAIAALNAAIDGHPENSGQAALDAEDLTDDHRLDALNSTLIPMTHPDGGTCDRYEKNADGDILVPAIEAAAMFDHGFKIGSDLARV
jgi:hypothetical protein